MISIQHLTKRFVTTTAVHDLSLEIHAGEIFGLIGPDGAGKTTTLRLIATALNPTSGRVMVDGIETTRDPEAIKKIIGYMPQRFALYPDLTVVENLNFFADLFGAPRATRAELIARLLGFARLDEFRTRLARHLSGGMQKKLALAAALELRRQQIAQLVKPGQVNLKHSHGGIVTIEYAIQYLQLMHGHKNPRLRTPNTLQALAALIDGGLIPSSTGEDLRKAYLFIRMLIDGLRMVRGNTKDLVLPPPESDEFIFLARRVGYMTDDWQAGARRFAETHPNQVEALIALSF